MVLGRGAGLSASTQAYHDPNHKPQTAGNEPEGAQQEEESGVTQQALPHESSGERQPEHQPAADSGEPEQPDHAARLRLTFLGLAHVGTSC
jgi:hypothetical protein